MFCWKRIHRFSVVRKLASSLTKLDFFPSPAMQATSQEDLGSKCQCERDVLASEQCHFTGCCMSTLRDRLASVLSANQEQSFKHHAASHVNSNKSGESRHLCRVGHTRERTHGVIRAAGCGVDAHGFVTATVAVPFAVNVQSRERVHLSQTRT